MDTDDEIRAARTRMMFRDGQRLLDDLGRIDTCGWNEPVATALLRFIREGLVRPLVVHEGLRGLAAGQAEATGWEAAWEELCTPALRAAASPWGVIWLAVRRAIRAEAVAAKYCTGLQGAWAARASWGPRSAPPVLSLDWLAEAAIEPVSVLDAGVIDLTEDELGETLSRIVEAMVASGWDCGSATELVLLIGHAPVRDGSQRAKAGWRPIAAELGLAPWKVRRTMVLLLGEPGWEGLLTRVRREGPEVVREAGSVAAIQSTVMSWMSSPARAARLAEAKAADRLNEDAA